jgi:hypothetical protein
MDSAATVQTIKDRQSHADHFTQKRIISRFGIRLFPAYNGYPRYGNLRHVTIERDVIPGRAFPTGIHFEAR